MNSIDLMIEEHNNIKRMLKIIRKYCNKILKEDEVNYEVFYAIIDFVRNYADNLHHGKEESILLSVINREVGDNNLK